MNIIDLFAGPGGWDVAATQLGLDPVGVEWDDAAVLTRQAAGLRTVHGDVALIDPVELRSEWFGGAEVQGLIASPPCQAYSMAGSGKGRSDVRHVMECVRELAQGRDTRAQHGELCEDERSMLVVEPLRWALILRPEWIAMEQVPPVLDLWKAMGEVLRGEGYSVWVGILSSEQYGVPQTRKRAILMASRVSPVHPPQPTHHAYKPGEPKPEASMDLFGDGLLPWVSMAEALGWSTDLVVSGQRGAGMVERHGERPSRPTTEPAFTVTGGEGRRAGPRWDVERKCIYCDGPAGEFDEHEACVEQSIREGMALRPNKAQPNAAERLPDQPAPTMAFGNCAPHWVPARDPENTGLRAGTNPNDTTRPATTPAPTVRFSERLNDVSWVPTHYDARQTGCAPRPVEDPSPTIQSSGLLKGRDVWTDSDEQTYSREAYLERKRQKDGAVELTEPEPVAPAAEGAGRNAVRVSETEAAILQGFPADYPWQGTRTKRFQQIGNAVPPPLAKAILSTLVR